MSDMTAIISRQLNWLLRPIDHLLLDPAVTDIHINGPGPDGITPIFVKRGAVRSIETAPLTMRDLENIGINAAALNRQDIAEDAPFCSTKLPAGQRVQLVRSPACPPTQYAIAIRRPSAKTSTPEELEQQGVFSLTKPSDVIRSTSRQVIKDMLDLKAAGMYRQMLELAISNGLTVIWAGMVGTGKTHNLRAFINAIPLDRRIVTVEDMEEVINLAHKNVVNLLYPKGKGQGLSKHTAEDCTEAALRLDMDVLINQELRDAAAWAFIRAIISGHPGMSSCHAPSAEEAYQAIALMARQHEAARTIPNEDLDAMLRDLIPVIAYCETIDGQRRVTQVHFDPFSRHEVTPQAAAALAGAR